MRFWVAFLWNVNFEVKYLAFWLFEIQFFMNLFIKLSMWHFFNPFHDIRMTPAHSTKPKSLDNNSFLFKLKLIRHTFVTELSKTKEYYVYTMLQKLSKCEVKAWLCRNLLISLPLRFYVETNLGTFKRSKNVIFSI